MPGYYIIGISGATNSGKSTLAHQLLKIFPDAKHICQDSYFLEPGNKNLEIIDIPGLKHANWEKLSAMDMKLMIKDVRDWIKQQEAKGDDSCPSLLIIEGILIFNHQELSSLFDKKYFLTLEFEVSLKRRLKRTYNPMDPPGYFDKIVWPMYLSNLNDIKHQDNIVYFKCDENTELMDLLQKISADIQKMDPSFERKHFSEHFQTSGQNHEV